MWEIASISWNHKSKCWWTDFLAAAVRRWVMNETVFSFFFFRMRRLSLLEIIFSLIKMMPLWLINWKPSTSSHESNYENFNFISSWGLAHRPYFNEICNYIPLSFINGCRCFFLSHSFRFINFHFLLSYPNWTCINVHILFTFFQYARAIAIVVKKMRRRMHPSS